MSSLSLQCSVSIPLLGKPVQIAQRLFLTQISQSLSASSTSNPPPFHNASNTNNPQKVSMQHQGGGAGPVSMRQTPLDDKNVLHFRRLVKYFRTSAFVLHFHQTVPDDPSF